MKCISCGAPIESAECPYCGTHNKTEKNTASDKNPTINVVINNGPARVAKTEPKDSEKNKIVAFILCLFFGMFGVHYFYVGKVGMGFLYLLTAGLCGIGWVVDIFRTICGSFKDDKGLYLK